MLTVETCNDGRGVSASTSLARVIWYVILMFLYKILVYLFDVANQNSNYCRSCRNQSCLFQCQKTVKRCFRKAVIVRPILQALW